MNGKTLTALCLTLALGLAGCAKRDSGGMNMGGDTASSGAIPANVVDVKNTVCVVSGDKVGDSKLFAVYEGKAYHLCCGDCPPEFKKDPAKYAKLVAADPAKYGVTK